MDSDSYPAENSSRLINFIVSNTLNNNKGGEIIWIRK